MSTGAKVFWAEGQFLRPQHFQQQDRYHESRLQRTTQALHPFHWGVLELEWDIPSLKANVLRVQGLSALFRDGELSDSPFIDPLPDGIDLSTLDPELQEVTYFAALPALIPNSTHAGRYVESCRPTTDANSQAATENLSYLHNAVQLIPHTEPRGNYVCFPLIRLRRVVSGGFEPDPGFIPPILSIDAAPQLATQLKQLMEALQAKVNALQGQMRQPNRNVIEFRSGDVSAYWLLHTVSAAGGQLMHYLQQPKLHPERLFEAMLSLTGALMTYSKSYELIKLPAYDHDDPGKSFSALDAIIRDLLDTVISSRYFTIPLVLEETCHHMGKLDSGKIDNNTAFYLAVGAAMPVIELVAAVPLLMKIGAPDDVEQFVLSALPGIELSHTPQVPAAIPIRPDACYFLLNSRSDLYERMLKAQSIMIYAPASMRELRLELIAVIA